MSATRDGKLWRCQFYYEDWQGIRHKKNKRGFKTKGEADAWERNFLQQQQKDLDINFENFVEIYFKDMENRLRESTIINKRYVFDLKVTPYFKNKKMCDIRASDVRSWQNALIKKGYAATYLKSINNQLAALFNYAVKYYDLRDNPCRKAGSIGKSNAEEMDFWTKQEFKEFLPSMDEKPEAKMAFLLLYWTGMRIGELLALTYEDVNLDKRIISINKSHQRIKGKDMITPPKTPKSNRKINKMPVKINNQEFTFSAGKHNELQKAIIEEFAPRFAPNSECLYVGDTIEKDLFKNIEKLQELGFEITLHDKMPDVVLYREDKDWIYFIESVTSVGPMDPKRIIEISEMTENVTAGKIFVTAFQNFAVFKNTWFPTFVV